MPSMPAGQDIEDWLASIRNPPRPPSVPNGPKGNAPAMERAAAAAAAAADGRYSDDKHWFCWSGADAAGGDTTRLLLLDCSLIILSDWTIISPITAVDNCGVVRENKLLNHCCWIALLIRITVYTASGIKWIESRFQSVLLSWGRLNSDNVRLQRQSTAIHKHTHKHSLKQLGDCYEHWNQTCSRLDVARMSAEASADSALLHHPRSGAGPVGGTEREEVPTADSSAQPPHRLLLFQFTSDQSATRRPDWRGSSQIESFDSYK